MSVHEKLFGTAAVMAARNPLVPKGAVAAESDTGVVKVGDGVTRYNSLSTVLYGTYARLGTPTADAPGLGLFFPEAHGAKGDYTHFNAAGTNINDGAMTNGSAVLTCATSTPFASTDVGKYVIVPGAGAAGVTLYTTVASYTSAGVVTLADAASTTVTGQVISYGTNDTAAIQAALDAAKAALGGVVLLKSRYLSVTGLAMNGAGVTLQGTGLGDTASGGMAAGINGWPTMSSSVDLVLVSATNCSIRQLALSGGGRDTLRLANTAGRFIGDSLKIQSALTGNGITHGTSVTSVTNKWSNLYVSSNAAAGILVNSSDTEWVNITTFSNGTDGMKFVGTSGSVVNLHTWGNAGNGLTLTGASHRVTNIYTETNTGDGVNSTSAESKVHGRSWKNTGRGAYVTGDRNELSLNCIDNGAEGAYIFSGTANKVLAGQFYDQQGGKTQTYGVRVGSGASNTYVGPVTANDADHVTAGILDGSTSTSWELGSRKVVLANDVVFNAATGLGDIVTAAACKAGRKFLLTALLVVDTSQAADVKFRVQVTGGTSSSGYFSGSAIVAASNSSSTAASVNPSNVTTIAASGGNSLICGGVGVGTLQGIWISGYVVVGTADATVALQAAQSTSDATNTTVHAGSWMELVPVP